MTTATVLTLAAPTTSPDTVAGVIGLYLGSARRRLCARNFAESERLLNLFADCYGTRQLSACRAVDLELWLDAQAQWRSDWTRKRVLGTVRACFGWAARLGVIDRNPFAGVSLPDGGRGRPMRAGELRALLRRTDACFRRVLWFLRWTGCRPGELAGLEWAQVDLARGLVVLPRHKTARTRKDRLPRVIVLCPAAARLLAWLGRRNPAGLGRVFVNVKGRPWTRYNLATRLKRLRRRLKLDKDCRLYGLRHAFGTDGVKAGLDLKTLSELMGHTSTRTTEVYVHLAGERQHLAQAVQRIFARRPR